MRGFSETAGPAQQPTKQEEEVLSSGDSEQGEPPRAVVPRWVQLVLLPLALLALWALAKAAGKVLLLFVVAAVIALILNPAVTLLQRSRLPRGLAVLTVYLTFFLALAGIGFLLSNPIANQVKSFTDNLPTLVHEANGTTVTIERDLNEVGIHAKFSEQGKTALQTLQGKLSKSAGKFVSFGGSVLSEAASAAFNLILVFVLSVYMLMYGSRIGALLRRLMPPGDGSRADDYPTLVQQAVSRYIGGQLLFSIVMGTTAGLALYIFGVVGIFPDGERYAVAFGAFLGVMELIPYLGPILGAVPPILVALFTDPITAVWVALLFLAIQQLEGHIVAPQIFGHTLRINPLVVIFGLLLGQHLYGIVGALIALPVLSVLRETAVYLKRHVTFEPWDGSRDRLL